MNFGLKNKKSLKFIFILSLGALGFVCIVITAFGSVWTEWDYKFLDRFYRLAAASGRGPSSSSDIIYLLVTDGSYRYFKKNTLDRKDLSGMNRALSALDPEAVAYDIIFARASSPGADLEFTHSIGQLESVFLPVGLEYSSIKKPFKWESGSAYQRFKNEYLKNPGEKGSSRPYYATRALMQADGFSEVAYNSGHISAFSDPDGVYRHAILLLKVEERFFPALALSLFLDYARVSLDEITVEWGHRIVIPAKKGNNLDDDVIIPIDDRGRAFIPFTAAWETDFKKMEAHALVKHFENINLHGNLADFFEGRYVFVGDVSVGTSDLGQTPLEADVPLIAIHTALFNGMLTNTFYAEWHLWPVLGVIVFIGVFLGSAALPKSSWFLYIGGLISFAGIFGLTWWQMLHFRLLPVVTVGGSALFILFILVVGLQIAVSRERAFIKNAFSRYISEKVVDELIAKPELLKLGGEERIITVLFSDLADFTTMSEKMPPADLVHLLNIYLTEMTDLVLEQGGIIDKYEGDAIMAEFGAPLSMPDHADMAVLTGLRMQKRLEGLNKEWKKNRLPEISCRIGINTGPMIVGNMGSNQVFDYTVIGDSVNLASRLEGANKRYRTRLMVSEYTHGYVTPDRFKTRVLDVIRVKGKSEPVKVFEVYAESSEVISHEAETYYRLYEEAFESYLSRDFAVANEKFKNALNYRKNDPAATEMLARIDAIHPEDLPSDWDGSIALTVK